MILIDVTTDDVYSTTLSNLPTKLSGTYLHYAGVFDIPLQNLDIQLKNKKGKKVSLYGIVIDEKTFKVYVLPIKKALEVADYSYRSLKNENLLQEKIKAADIGYNKFFQLAVLKLRMSELNDCILYRIISINNKKDNLNAPTTIEWLEDFYNSVLLVDYMNGNQVKIPVVMHYLLSLACYSSDFNKIQIKPYMNTIEFDENLTLSKILLNS